MVVEVVVGAGRGVVSAVDGVTRVWVGRAGRSRTITTTYQRDHLSARSVFGARSDL